MTDFNELTIDQLRARRSLKWCTHPADVLPMWVAEMDFLVAAPIQQAICDAVTRQEYGYPCGESDLAEAFISWATKTFQTDFNPGLVTGLPDVLHGVALAIEAFTSVGAKIIVPSPAYMPFWTVPRLVGRRSVGVGLKREQTETGIDRFVMDLDQIDRAFAEGAEAIILCQPHNPTGRVYQPQELAALCEVVEAHHGFVICDEIHAPLVFAGANMCYSSLSGTAASHSIAITSASKAWNLPGLRCALAYAKDETVFARWAKQAIPERTHGYSTIGKVAMAAAFNYGQPWLDGCLAQIKSNEKMLRQALQSHASEVWFPEIEGTYLGWLDFSELNLGQDPAEFFLAKSKLALNSGPAFGPEGAGFARINLATTTQIMEAAIDRLLCGITSHKTG